MTERRSKDAQAKATERWEAEQKLNREAQAKATERWEAEQKLNRDARAADWAKEASGEVLRAAQRWIGAIEETRGPVAEVVDRWTADLADAATKEAQLPMLLEERDAALESDRAWKSGGGTKTDLQRASAAAAGAFNEMESAAAGHRAAADVAARTVGELPSAPQIVAGRSEWLQAKAHAQVICPQLDEAVRDVESALGRLMGAAFDQPSSRYVDAYQEAYKSVAAMLSQASRLVGTGGRVTTASESARV
ncbi:MAG: hypothetical protein U0Q22_15190 [Acidimicrobiales bacterium]